jgi:hypothetical protein
MVGSGDSAESKNSGSTAILNRRSVLFGASLSLSGLAIVILCLVPLFITYGTPKSIFPDLPQEEFFFDLIGWIGGAWLFTWVSALNGWRRLARVGQWLGIILLCLDQAILIGVWSAFTGYKDFWAALYVVPALLQVFFLGYFMGFFILPSLTNSGNRILTGLGTLAVLLPWLLGRDAIVLGTQCLCGMFLSANGG